MNPHVVTAILRYHTPKYIEEWADGWRTLCACGTMTADHDEHVAHMVATLAEPPPTVALDQLSLLP
jgi:hypothetical protein